MCLSICCEKRLGHIRDARGSLFKLRNITHFSLLENFTSNFPLQQVNFYLSFVVMIFGTCAFILILLFMYKKCFHEKVKVYFGKRLADCVAIRML